MLRANERRLEQPRRGRPRHARGTDAAEPVGTALAEPVDFGPGRRPGHGINTHRIGPAALAPAAGIGR